MQNLTGRKRRVGLIGLGRIATTGHIPAYLDNDVELVAVCTTQPERAADVLKSLPIRPTIYSDAKLLAADPAVEIIDVTTRQDQRSALLPALFAFKKPVLAQKPLSNSVCDAARLVELAHHEGVVLAVNQNHRWMPTVGLLKAAIEKGRLGRLRMFHHVNCFNEDTRAWYTDDEHYMLVDHGLHYLDLARWVLGETPKAVSARMGSANSEGSGARCPLNYNIMLRFESTDLLASLYFNNSAPAPAGFQYQLLVDGDQATAKLGLNDIEIISQTGDVERQSPKGEWVPDGIYGAYAALNDALDNDSIPPHSGLDHLRSLELAWAAVQSAKSDGEWVAV